MKKWMAVALMTFVFAGIAEAKKTKPAAKPSAEQQQPKRNFIDLRGAQFFCNESLCALDVASYGLIACSVNGCASMTDILVSTGPVTRIVAPPAPPQALSK